MNVNANIKIAHMKRQSSQVVCVDSKLSSEIKLTKLKGYMILLFLKGMRVKQIVSIVDEDRSS